MAVEYTHDYEITIGDLTIQGEAEFNVDGKASFETEDALPNLTVGQNKVIGQLFELARVLFVEFEGLDLINIQKKI